MKTKKLYLILLSLVIIFCLIFVVIKVREKCHRKDEESAIRKTEQNNDDTDQIISELEKNGHIIKTDKIIPYVTRGYSIIPFLYKYYSRYYSYFHPYVQKNKPSKESCGGDLINYFLENQLIFGDQWIQTSRVDNKRFKKRFSETKFSHGAIFQIKLISSKDFKKKNMDLEKYFEYNVKLFKEFFFHIYYYECKQLVVNVNCFKYFVFDGIDCNGNRFTRKELHIKLKSAFFVSYNEFSCLKKKMICFRCE